MDVKRERKMKVFLRVRRRGRSMLDKRYKTKIAFLHYRNHKYYTDVFISNAVLRLMLYETLITITAD